VYQEVLVIVKANMRTLVSEDILKIGKYLTKIWKKVCVGFLTDYFDYCY